MLAGLGRSLSAFFRASAPDPFVIAVLLTALTAVLALAFGDAGLSSGELLDVWQGGLWNLLAFSMQMCLILVTGHALAASGPVSWVIRSVAGMAGSARSGVVVVCVVSMLAGLVNWGFGLIVGAILAREVGRSLEMRGIACAPGLLAAAGYTTMLTWHGGLSGSAPLAAADAERQAEILGAELFAQVGVIETTQTLFSGLNAVATGGLLVIVPLLLVLMCPRKSDGGASGVSDEKTAERGVADHGEGQGIVPRWLERSPVVAWGLALAMGAWLIGAFMERGLAALNLNSAILLMFALGLLLHGSARSYADAVKEGATGCAGIIVQFPLYGGIMAMMTESGLAGQVSAWFVSVAGDSSGALSLLTFASAGLVNLFVPSGGGQWAVQAPVAMQAAVETGTSPARLVMAIAYGDELTNMLQPFWALPLLAITRARVQDVVAYTAVVMVVAGVWLGLCLWFLG